MKAIYPGSFDPITFGHIDIIKRISSLFDEVTVLVAESMDKKPLFSATQRREMINQCLPELTNVTVDSFEGLTVNYALSNQAKTIVRGIRAVADFEYEMAMGNMNKSLAPEIETLIVFSNPQYNFISSRMVKEVAKHGGPLHDLVPEPVVDQLKKIFAI